MLDLTTTYLGMTLNSPLVVSSNPLCANLDSLRQLEAAGAGAVVLPSLFEEQIVREDLGLQYYLEQTQQELPDALQNIPDMEEYNRGVDGYLTLIYRAKQGLEIPVIASLNGSSSGGWVRYARLLEAAGADALELNVYDVPTQADISAYELEAMYVRLVKSVRGSINIPVAVKLSPFFTSVPHVARQLDEAGATGLVLFNRFYQPDFDLEAVKATPNLQLSDSAELRLRLRWVAILYGQVRCSLAVTGGVHTAQDALKAIFGGAQVAMVASVLLKYGPDYLARLLADLTRWLEGHGHTSLRDIRGQLSLQVTGDASAFERANYIQVLHSYYDSRTG